jgi:hypothetical protein
MEVLKSEDTKAGIALTLEGVKLPEQKSSLKIKIKSSRNYL